MKQIKLRKQIELSDTFRYRFDEMEVGQVIAIVCKKNERDRKFHSCRTRCKQVSVDGKKFKAYADDHSVYYKREA